jgi:hypothetical protein
MGCNGQGPCNLTEGSDKPQALITAEVDVAPQIQSQVAGQGQQWVLARPGAFVPSDPRASKA